MNHIEDSPEKPYNYFNKPSLILRVKSMMIDSVVLLLLMYLGFIILNSLEVESGITRKLVLAIILLYEPILITINRTIGQRIMGLRVRRFSQYVKSDTKANITFLHSLIRFIVKIILGWVSLITIHSDKYGQAIHDKLGNSIMAFE